MYPGELPHPSPPLGPSPGDRARIALLLSDDAYDQPDWVLAKHAECSTTTVRRARLELERLGVIGHREPDLSEDAWRPGRTWHDGAGRTPQLTPHQRACLKLEADPRASDQRLAERAACARTVVREARRELEALGAIPAVGSGERDRRTDPHAHQDHDASRKPLPPQPASMARGLCASGSYDPPNWWHPGRYDHATRQRALSICHQCPALADCRAWSLQLPASDKYAIYGGMTANQRARIQRASRP
jgi:hypothetical protein